MGRVVLAAILFLAGVCCIAAQFCPSPPVPGGSLSFSLDQGSADCSKVSSYVPSLLVNWYDDSTAIIQQRRCVNANAPFMYLLLGQERALLIDTGATVDASAFDLQATVEQTIGQWIAARNITRDQYELVVSHTDSSPSHVSGDVQFVGAAGTTLVGADVPSVCSFFDIAQWPFDYGSLSLDLERSVAVIPAPGPSPSSVVFYDCRTDLVFSGELLTPGYVSIADGQGALSSAGRVLEFLMDHTTAVSHVLGSHVEMSSSGGAYGVGESFTPKLHNLSLPVSSLVTLFNILKASAAQPQFPTTVTPDFIVQPATRQPLPPGGRMGDHGMLVARLVQGALPTPLLLLSHVPMYRQPHDYQILLLATVNTSSVSPLPVPAPPAPTGVYSLDPGVDLSLNDIVEGRTTSLPAQLYQGSFQGTGVIVSNITLSVQSRAVVSWLDNSTAIPYTASIYFSVPQNSSSTVSSGPASLFLLHHMKQKPDYDHLIRVTFDPSACSVGPSFLGVHGPRSLADPFATGAQWQLMGRVNSAATRPLPGQTVLAQLVGDPHDTVCSFSVAEELSCLVGPDFFDNC